VESSYDLPTCLGNRCCDSHISTARRLLHSLSNQSRKEPLISYLPYLFSRLIFRLEKTVWGATLSVRQKGTVLQRAFGSAKTVDAVFLIASITKPIDGNGPHDLS